MVEASVTNRTIGSPDSKLSAIVFIARPISELGSFINDLVKGRKDVVSKLHFSNTSCSRCSKTNSKSCYSLLG